MALNKQGLKSAILSEFQKQGYILTEANQKLATAIANAVVDHITGSAEVVGGTCTDGGPISGGKVI